MNNFILVKDDVFDSMTCDHIIDYFNKVKSDKDKYYNIVYEAPLFKKEKLQDLYNTYFKTFPEAGYIVDGLSLKELRIKHFKDDKFFSSWHHENNLKCCHRVLAMMIYLSDHDCGTEFMSGEIVKSKKGRGVMFPAYFTHNHRGQKCPENKDRYVYGGYFHHVK